MVIHGGIDGFTRIPVFLKCSTNNRAETVLDAFLHESYTRIWIAIKSAVRQRRRKYCCLSVYVTTPSEGARERKHDHRSQCSQPKNRKVVA